MKTRLWPGGKTEIVLWSASRVATEQIVNELLQRVGEEIRNRRLIPAKGRVLVAVSGGLDSMALLHLLRTLSKDRQWQLTVAHFNHQLRGKDSELDEDFVRGAAANLDLPCVVERGDVRQRMTVTKASLEMAARDLRHEFLSRTARQLKMGTIALAHHADDQAELYFLRLLRGAGGEGLGGMKWISPSPVHSQIKLVRPLLNFRRSELEEYIAEQQITYREDTSNASRDFLRNRIRHDLLPMLAAQFDPAVVTTVLRCMEIVSTDAAYAEASAREWLKESVQVAFAKLHPAVQRQALRLQLQRLNIREDFDLIERLRVHSDQRSSAPGAKEIYRDETGLIQICDPEAGFQSDMAAIDLSGEQREVHFGGLDLKWVTKETKARKLPGRTVGRQIFDADKVGPRVELRCWREGDRFQPIGMRQAVKLQDLFTNLKIPRNHRRRLVLAVSDKAGIFWVEGLRIGEIAKVGPATTRLLEWKWKRIIEPKPEE